MLQIFLRGRKESGFLDLLPNASLDLETLDDLFDDDLSLGEYSLPVEAPLTGNNSRLLGFPEQLFNVLSPEDLVFIADIYSDGLPVRYNARVTITDIQTTFTNRGNSITLNIAGNKGMFGYLVKGKKLMDIAFDEIRYTGLSARQFATKVMKKEIGYARYEGLAFAPVVIADYFDEDRPEYSDEFLYADTVNSIVTSGNDWEFGCPNSTSSGPALAGSDEYLNHRTVPFFTFKFVLRRLFTTFGYTLTGSWMDDPAWDALYLFNTQSLEKYNSITKTDLSNNIQPAMHMPDKEIGKFLSDLQNTFCLKFSFLDNNIVRMDYRKRSFRTTPLNLTHITVNTAAVSVPDYANNGFSLRFDFGDDSLAGERVQNIEDKIVVASVRRYVDIPNVIIGRPFTFNDLIYVSSENQYYCYSNGAGITGWEYFSEDLLEKKIGNGEKDISSELTPVATNLQYNEDIDRLALTPMVGAGMKGCYYNRYNINIRNPFGAKMFYIRLKDGHPVSFIHSRNITDQKIAAVSLSWTHEDGLYNYCWREWIEFLLRTKLIKTQLMLDYRTMAELEATDIVNINSVLYIKHQMNIIFPLRGLQDIELYRL